MANPNDLLNRKTNQNSTANESDGYSYGYGDDDSLMDRKDTWYNVSDGWLNTGESDNQGMNGQTQNTGSTPAGGKGKKKSPLVPILLGGILVVLIAVMLLLLKSCGMLEKKPEPSDPQNGAAVSQTEDASAETTQPSLVHYEMRLNTTRLVLFVEDSYELTVSGIPEDAAPSWSSSNKNVADVEGGVIRARSVGTAIVTATWKNDGATLSVTAEVTVEAMGVSLSTYEIQDFYVGQSMTITGSTSPAGEKLTWESSNENVAVVNSGGVVTATGSGTAIITASFGEYSKTCTVTVTEPGITLSKTVSTLYLGDSTIVEAEVSPETAAVKWTSADNTIATVSEDHSEPDQVAGKITAVSEGTTTITAKITFEGQTYETECAVTVTKPSVTLSETNLSLLPGGTATLKETIKPSGCTVTWDSSNKTVATVDGGKVTAVAPGTATITAKFTYKNKTYEESCEVKVGKPRSITVATLPSKTVYTVGENLNTDGLTLKVTFDDGSSKTVSSGFTCSAITSRPNGAPVTETITVTYMGCTTTFTVTVEEAATQVSGKSITVVVLGESFDGTYSGDWRYGKPNGYGEFTLSGATYKGEWSNGTFHGSGTLTLYDGSYMTGGWVEGNLYGYCEIYNTDDGMMYKGDVVNNQFHGYGVYDDGQGNVYEGEWQNDQRHGQGKMTYADGTVEEGRWEYDKFVG